MEKQMGQLQQDLRALLKEAQQGLPQDLSHYISLMEDVVGSLHKRLHSSSATAQLQLTPPVSALPPSPTPVTENLPLALPASDAAAAAATVLLLLLAAVLVCSLLSAW
eukprot:jgi/Mesen1/4891/ME000244S04071